MNVEHDNCNNHPSFVGILQIPRWVCGSLVRKIVRMGLEEAGVGVSGGKEIEWVCWGISMSSLTLMRLKEPPNQPLSDSQKKNQPLRGYCWTINKADMFYLLV